MVQQQKVPNGKSPPEADVSDDENGFLDALKDGDVPQDFLSKDERQQTENHAARDPFEGWEVRNGLPLLPVKDGTPVTAELVQQLFNELL